MVFGLILIIAAVIVAPRICKLWGKGWCASVGKLTNQEELYKFFWMLSLDLATLVTGWLVASQTNSARIWPVTRLLVISMDPLIVFTVRGTLRSL
jgi:hypothetical protein